MKQMAKKDTRMENHINGTVGCVHHLRIQNLERAVGAEIFPACRLRIDSSIMQSVRFDKSSYFFPISAAKPAPRTAYIPIIARMSRANIMPGRAAASVAKMCSMRRRSPTRFNTEA